MASALRKYLAQAARQRCPRRPVRPGEAPARRISKDPSPEPGTQVSATLPPETTGPATPLQIFEDSFSILALSLMTALPVIEMISRQFRWSGIPGSAVIVPQLTLWIGRVG